MKRLQANYKVAKNSIYSLEEAIEEAKKLKEETGKEYVVIKLPLDEENKGRFEVWPDEREEGEGLITYPNLQYHTCKAEKVAALDNKEEEAIQYAYYTLEQIYNLYKKELEISNYHPNGDIKQLNELIDEYKVEEAITKLKEIIKNNF